MGREASRSYSATATHRRRSALLNFSQPCVASPWLNRCTNSPLRDIEALFGEANRVRPRFASATDHRPRKADLLSAGVRRDDLYMDLGVSGARASRTIFDKALDALHKGDTLVVTRLGRLGRSTQNMLAFSEALKVRGAGLHVLNLGGGDVDTSTPMGSMLFPIMAALAHCGIAEGPAGQSPRCNRCPDAVTSQCFCLSGRTGGSAGLEFRAIEAGEC